MLLLIKKWYLNGASFYIKSGPIREIPIEQFKGDFTVKYGLLSDRFLIPELEKIKVEVAAIRGECVHGFIFFSKKRPSVVKIQYSWETGRGFMRVYGILEPYERYVS